MSVCSYVPVCNRPPVHGCLVAQPFKRPVRSGMIRACQFPCQQWQIITICDSWHASCIVKPLATTGRGGLFFASTMRRRAAVPCSTSWRPAVLKPWRGRRRNSQPIPAVFFSSRRVAPWHRPSVRRVRCAVACGRLNSGMDVASKKHASTRPRQKTLDILGGAWQVPRVEFHSTGHLTHR